MYFVFCSAGQWPIISPGEVILQWHAGTDDRPLIDISSLVSLFLSSILLTFSFKWTQKYVTDPFISCFYFPFFCSAVLNPPCFTFYSMILILLTSYLLSCIPPSPPHHQHHQHYHYHPHHHPIPPPSPPPSIFSCFPADVWEAASPLELHNHPHHQGVRNTKYKTRQIQVSVIVTVITDRCTNCKSSAKEPSSCRVRRLFWGGRHEFVAVRGGRSRHLATTTLQRALEF